MQTYKLHRHRCIKKFCIYIYPFIHKKILYCIFLCENIGGVVHSQHCRYILHHDAKACQMPNYEPCFWLCMFWHFLVLYHYHGYYFMCSFIYYFLSSLSCLWSLLFFRCHQLQENGNGSADISLTPSETKKVCGYVYTCFVLAHRGICP